MSNKQSFVLVSTAHGTMITPRFDYKKKDTGDYELGVGANLLEWGHHDMDGISVMAAILEERRKQFGVGVIMVDAGANIGTVTLSLARHMTDWGKVHAFEPQDRVFMALCGNIVMNNLENVQTYRAALGRKDGLIDFPIPDYNVPGQFGGVNALGQADIGQKLTNMTKVPTKRIDSLNLPRLDFIKLDIEGMEIEALIGGMETISRCHPIIFAEWICCGKDPLVSCLTKFGYQTVDCGIDLVAVHGKNEIIDRLRELNQKVEAA